MLCCASIVCLAIYHDTPQTWRRQTTPHGNGIARTGSSILACKGGKCNLHTRSFILRPTDIMPMPITIDLEKPALPFPRMLVTNSASKRSAASSHRREGPPRPNTPSHRHALPSEDRRAAGMAPSKGVRPTKMRWTWARTSDSNLRGMIGACFRVHAGRLPCRHLGESRR